MRILVIGASGFVGTKLARKLMVDGQLGEQDISELTLVDIQKPEIPVNEESKIKVNQQKVDMSQEQNVQNLVEESRPDVIFHLAAIVSGEAESNFDLGYKVNVDGTRFLLETIRHKVLSSNGFKPPRMVFTSSLAVYGTPLPKIIPDDYATTPRCSYGVQKAICELYLEDYTRKGYADAISIRYPTIAIRPGKPNKAASSFISGIVREPLNGQEAVLPVNMDFRHTVASPRKAVEFLLQAATLKPENPGDRAFNVPGVSLTVQEMVEALQRVAGKETTALIQHKPDPFIVNIVESWPKEFDCQKALRLGFLPDASYDDILRAYMKDELGTESPTKKQKQNISSSVPLLV